jgi:tRNA threonylcarbamoyladenosine biosynthesis protein TsaB
LDQFRDEIRIYPGDYREMKILALELSTARGSLAWRNGDVDLVREWPNDRKHSGLFFENLAEMQKQFGLPETIIVGLGPGSYAGTRIAISTAIGLQLAANAQLIGYPSIGAVETEENEYCVIGDARRSTFFFARIRTNNLIEGPTLLSEAELKEKLGKLEDKMPIFSSEPLPQFERAAVRYPSAQIMARLAQDSNRSFSLPPLEPMYLREPHITVPRSATIP